MKCKNISEPLDHWWREESSHFSGLLKRFVPKQPHFTADSNVSCHMRTHSLFTVFDGTESDVNNETLANVKQFYKDLVQFECPVNALYKFQV